MENFEQKLTRSIEQYGEKLNQKPMPMWSFWVSLRGWQKGREVRVQEGYAYFEVAEQGHCSICQSRIAHVRSLGRDDIRYAYLNDRYPSDSSTLWAGIPVSEGASQADIIAELRDKLKLPIL